MAAPAPPRLDPIAARRQLARLARAQPAPAWLLGEIGRRMDERLSWIRHRPADALVWWPELGGGAALLQQRYPGVRLQAQAVPGAEEPGRDRSLWRALTRALQPRAALPFDATTAASVDLVWANMMLHWAGDLPALLSVWQQALRVDGFLMFSCFGPDTVRELQAVHDALGWGAIGPPFIDMHDLGDLLVHGGFADPVMDMEMITLSWADLPSMLAELRSLGGNVAPGRAPVLRTPRARDRWAAAAEAALRGPDGRLQLRFEIVYGHAFKPVPRADVKAETHVSLDTMRTLVKRGRSANGG